MKSKFSLIIKITGLLFFVAFFWQVKSAQAESIEALGWGWIGNAEKTYASPGFISFNCENKTPGPSITNPTSCVTNDYQVIVDTEAGTVEGTAWLGYTDVTSKIGGIRFSADPNNYLINISHYYLVGTGPEENITNLPSYVQDFINSDPDHYVIRYDSSGNISGWARIMELARYGWETYGSSDWGWIKLRGTWNDGTDSGEYGVSFIKDYYPNVNNDLTGYQQSAYGKFEGWGWNYDGSDETGTTIPNTSFGFIGFNMGETGSTASEAWLQTLYGDVYSQGNISVETPAGQYNATYLILSSGSISDFDTSLSGGSISFYDPLYYPELYGVAYRSNIGKIDITNLESSATTITSFPSDPLNGGVYYWEGTGTPKTVTLTSDISINNGSGTKGSDPYPSGNGTIIIDGDLNIQNNIGYSDATVENLYNLASIAWIVKGDVTIAPSVTQVVGNFIVLGNTAVPAAGTISTGPASNLPLTVYGLMMAKEFNFERQTIEEAGFDVPSEKIIYDGRALLNTPPGLEDLVATLPELEIANP